MINRVPTTENYFYELLKKKYHTSEVIRAQIAEIIEKTKDRVAEEPLKSLTVKFRGQVIDSSFEKTLKIVSKRLFRKGNITGFHAFKEQGIVEANITATLTETESLIHYLMRPHIVLHCKKGIVKGASNLLIIDETEQKQLDNFTPDYIHRNCVTHAETYEKYMGRLGEYLIFNGLPLTSEKIGSELRFNKIKTKNRVFTTTGLKEIYLNLHLISLILKLDLEQHYLKLRVFDLQENDLKSVEEKIDSLGFFADIFDHIATTNNPLLYHEELFLDLIRLEHIIENNNWKSIPAYAGYLYSAANRINDKFRLLEEYNLFLTYAKCIEKFISKLLKKLSRHKSDIHSEQENLTANYHELQKLHTISNYPLLQKDYQELLNSFRALLAYLDFLVIQDGQSDGRDGSPHIRDLAGRFTNNLGAFLKKQVESLFSVKIDVSPKTVLHHNKTSKTAHEDEIQRLISRFNEDMEKVSSLKTVTGEDAFLEARRCIPQLTNLTYILDQLKELIRDVENKKEIHDPFSVIFAGSNKFEILYKELHRLGILETEQEQEAVRRIVTDMQKFLFHKPLKEKAYQEIINNIQSLEYFVVNKNKLTLERDTAVHNVMAEIYQHPIFKTIIGIKTDIKSIIEKDVQAQKIDTFKDDGGFFSYSTKELDRFMAGILRFHEEIKNSCYYKNTSAYDTLEKKFDCLIHEVKDIDAQISHNTRNSDKKISKAPDVHINYLKTSQLMRNNLESTIFLLQNQITQIYEFIHAIENHLHRHSFIHSGVATSVLFDQITFLLSKIDVRLIEMTESAEHMFQESVNTIFHYQAGETFLEPKKEDLDGLMKEIENRTIVRTYQNCEKHLRV